MVAGRLARRINMFVFFFRNAAAFTCWYNVPNRNAGRRRREPRRQEPGRASIWRGSGSAVAVSQLPPHRREHRLPIRHLLAGGDFDGRTTTQNSDRQIPQRGRQQPKNCFVLRQWCTTEARPLIPVTTGVCRERDDPEQVNCKWVHLMVCTRKQNRLSCWQ